MTEPARAAEVPAPRPWVTASFAGVVAFLCVGALALVIGIVEWLAVGRPFGVRLTWKLAGLYVGTFHGAGIELHAGSPTVRSTGFDPPGLVPAFVGTGSTVHVTFLLGTILAGAALWRAGRRVARQAGGDRRRRIAWGAAIAPAYALLVLGVALGVRLSFPAIGLSEVRIIPEQASVGALLLAAAAGAAGGAASAAPAVGRTAAWLRGGWRMSVALVVLAFAAFLIAAGVRSDVSSGYVRFLSDSGAGGAVMAVHHVLLVPNQSFLIAAPAMGGCLRLDTTNSQPTTLCLLTVRPNVQRFMPELGSAPVSIPSVWLLLLLIPAVATAWGGLAAGAGARRASEAAICGAGAGFVFAVLVVAGEALSAIWLTREPGGALIYLGADLARTGAFACAWGIGGGMLGAVVASRRQAEPVVADPPPDPPSPTSV